MIVNLKEEKTIIRKKRVTIGAFWQILVSCNSPSPHLCTFNERKMAICTFNNNKKNKAIMDRLASNLSPE
jgi:hypothetical protein